MESIKNKYKIRYFAHFDQFVFLGIEKKIKQTVKSLKNLGYNAESIIVSNLGFKSHWKMLILLFKANADLLILRSTVSSMPILVFAIIWQRLVGTRIIIEIPTPVTIVLKEIKMLKKGGTLANKLRLSITSLSFPWVLYPAHRIIQYAPESYYFSFGLKNKMKLHTNGIDVSSIPGRSCFPVWPSNEFVMIGVASLAPWHGYDRIIRGIADYLLRNKNSEIVPKMIIVGDGEVRSEWQELAKNLKICDNIEFVGFKKAGKLNNLFNQAHMAIASIGLYRKGLNMASDLKSREYAARGLPFVSSGRDIDFEPLPEFIYKVENGDESINIEKIIEWYSNYAEPSITISGKKIRKFAEERLDYKNKISHFLFDDCRS